MEGAGRREGEGRLLESTLDKNGKTLKVEDEVFYNLEPAVGGVKGGGRSKIKFIFPDGSASLDDEMVVRPEEMEKIEDEEDKK